MNKNTISIQKILKKNCVGLKNPITIFQCTIKCRYMSCIQMQQLHQIKSMLKYVPWFTKKMYYNNFISINVSNKTHLQSQFKKFNI